MGPTNSKKRKLEDSSKARTFRPKKKFRKQTNYDSSSSSPSGDEFAPVDLAASDSDISVTNSLSSKPFKPHSSPSASDASDPDSDLDSDSASDSSSFPQDPSHPGPPRKIPKRRDPTAFSASLSTILSTKLPPSTRSDPLLSRSKTAKEASSAVSELRLETKARRALRDERKKASEKGRVRDVLLGDWPRGGDSHALNGNEGGREGCEDLGEGDGTAAQILEQERRLRKTAQRGVVKLFNAVRAAQVKGEEAAREARAKGLVGAKRREERVGEMGKQAFLEMVAGGGR